MKKCEFCKEKIQSKATKCIHCGEFQKRPIKPFYKKWWFISLAVLFVISLFIPDSTTEDTGQSSKLKSLENTNSNPKYEILEKVTKGQLENYYLLFQESDDIKEIEKSSRTIKATLCNSKCNIHLFNEKDTKGLYKKYPLDDNELLYVADRQIGTLSFTDDFTYYPLQDFKYKELGGRNYKK